MRLPRPWLYAASLATALALGTASGSTAAVRRNLQYNLPEDRLEVFAFDLRQVVDTAFTRLPPEAKAYDTDDLMERIGRSDTRASGRMERVVARAFRDGSLGLVTRVAALEGSTDRGEGARPLELASLVGKSLSLRVLDSGQLVDSFGWAHMAGAGGGGDLVADMLVQSVLRLPNILPNKRPVLATWELRLPVDPFLERVQAWTLTWTEADAPEDCPRCTALAYTGSIRESSADAHPARPMSLEGTASVEGTVVLSRPGRRLLAHSWTIRWKRSVRSHRANKTLRGELSQTVELSGSLKVEAP